MSWTKTYTHTLAVAVDILTASVLWNSYDVTISSRCGIALKTNGPWVLRVLGKGLNKLQTNHCNLAIEADIMRAKNALTYLGAS